MNLFLPAKVGEQFHGLPPSVMVILSVVVGCTSLSAGLWLLSRVQIRPFALFMVILLFLGPWSVMLVAAARFGAPWFIYCILLLAGFYVWKLAIAALKLYIRQPGELGDDNAN